MKKIVKKVLERYRSTNMAVKASIWLAFCSFFQKGISVITMPIYTRIMSMEQYGQYNVYLSWYNIMAIVITLNIQLEMFNRGVINHSEEKDEFTANQMGLILVMGGLWLVVYLIFRNFLNLWFGLTTMLFLAIIIEIITSAIISLWSARKRFEFDYKKIVKLTLAISITNPIVGIAMVLSTEYKAEANLLSNAVVPLMFSILLICEIAKKGHPFRKMNWWKTSVISCLPLVPHYLSLILLNQSDKLMINHFMGASDAAIYSVAHSAGLIMTLINSSVNGSFVPWAYEKMKNKNGKGIFEVSRSLFILVAGVNLLLIWLAPEIIAFLAAPQYKEAIWCVVPITVSVYFFFVYTLFVDIEIYYGASQYIAIASICAAGLNILLNYAFIPQFGYLAAGYTTLASYFVTMLMHLVFLIFTLEKSGQQQDIFDLNSVALCGITLIIFSALAMALYSHPILRLSIIGLFLIVAISQKDKIFILFAQIKK